ncbi:hypothetical protein HPP92_020295 [Vanilla planifolia]|uniref:ACT domain-containing protein ACR n=1 Tax=Vanilla planifolia TaxID=51239 RepID=A0A835PVA5_VANPL|nr:hypothetical protein HPP92_020696 [Vanilla planifolia]KAG0461819.1 hypothetical protein HPP92_020295 [Vanilla planifolia]
MDVFHITDRHGHKLTDEAVISHIEQSLCCSDDAAAISSGGIRSLTTLELTGADRPGLLSEVFAVLADLQYSVAHAKLWTYKGRVAALIFVEEESGAPVEELDKIRCIKARLRNVVSVSFILRGPRPH